MEESVPDPNTITAWAAFIGAIVAVSAEIRRWLRKDSSKDE